MSSSAKVFPVAWFGLRNYWNCPELGYELERLFHPGFPCAFSGRVLPAVLAVALEEESGRYWIFLGFFYTVVVGVSSFFFFLSLT